MTRSAVPRPSLLAGSQMLSRYGLWRDPLITWMERRWRMLPDAAGASVWKGRCDGWPVRLWTGGGDDRHRATGDRYRLAFGSLPAGPELRFHRDRALCVAGRPGRPAESPAAATEFFLAPIRIGSGFELELTLDPADRAFDRIAEITAIVRGFSDAVTMVAFTPGGTRLEIRASRSSEASLTGDARLAVELVELDLAPVFGRRDGADDGRAASPSPAPHGAGPP